MTTLKDIHKILRSSEKERLTIELKRWEALTEKEEKTDKNKLAFEIVAFANRLGGRLIIGVNDAGNPQGNLPETTNIDRLKQKLDNICHTQISPRIDYKIEHLHDISYDILVIHIPKRKSMPHAYINIEENENKIAEIKSRTYYIRTRYGKRLVNDSQLQWLFNHLGDPDFTYRFRTQLTYNNQDWTQLLHSPKNYYGYDGVDFCFWRLLKKIKESKVKCSILNLQDLLNHKHEKDFFSDVATYAFLFTLLINFQSSYLREFEVGRGWRRWKPIIISKERLDNEQNYLSEIQMTNSVYGEFLKEEIKDYFFRPWEPTKEPYLSVPKNTKIVVGARDGEGYFALKHEDFKFEFKFKASSVNPGLPSTHPEWEAIKVKNEGRWQKVQENEKIYKNYNTLVIDGSFRASFNYPENEIEDLEKYYQYAEDIKNILDIDWNYDRVLEQLPHQKIYGIEAKVDMILDILRQQNHEVT